MNRYISVDRDTQIVNMSVTIHMNVSNGIKLGNMSVTIHRSVTSGTTKVDNMSMTRQMSVQQKWTI